MWLVISIIAMLCWSGSDFFSKLGSKPSDKYSHWKMVMAVGVVMGLHAFYEMATGTAVTMRDIIYYLPASAMYILSMIFGYVSLRYIELSISSPICNSSGAIAAVLCFLVLGQTIDGLSAVGVVIVSLGVLLLGVAEYTEDDEAKAKRQLNANRKYAKSVLAILLPVLYCFIDAAGTFFDAIILEEGNTFMTGIFHYLDEDVANVAYELTFLFMAIVAAVYVFVIKKQRLGELKLREEGPKALGAVCETAGQFAYIYALAANPVGAAPIICAYCVVSSVWSAIFLKERLSWKHYAALIAVFAGIIIMGVAEGFAEA